MPTKHVSQWLLTLQVVAALVLLNALTSFVNVWPTPLVRPDTRIGPEFVALWVILLALAALYGRIGHRAVALLTGLFVLVAIGRYADVVVPAWFGRKLNLYWDARHLPRFLEVASQQFTGWQLLGLALAVVASLWLLVWIIRACIRTLAWQAAPRALRSPLALVVTIAVVAMVGANMARIGPSNPYVAGPVFPVYQRQAEILMSAYLPGRAASVLPPSPPLHSDLGALNGADVKVVFLESYGATTYTHPDIAEVISPARERLLNAAGAHGRQVLSAFVRAATFGGASDLSHLSFLSGIDLTDPLRHDVLLTTDRGTMLDTFEQAGYRTIGLYPAMSWEWPEERFYGFEHYLDGPSLGYRGPKLGLWWLPDQFSMARVNELYPPDPAGRPRFVFFPTINSHIPYRPTPPYQPEWSRVTSATPFADEEVAAALAESIDWNSLLPGYISTIGYTFDWLAGYQALPQPRDWIMVLVGDHQPAGGFTGPNASWDVPVHIVTDNPLIAGRLQLYGFIDGMDPPRVPLGHVSDLNQILLSVFDSGATRAPVPGDDWPQRVARQQGE
jgi:hypothetical protein